MMKPCVWIQINCCSSIRLKLSECPTEKTVECPICHQPAVWQFLVSGQTNSLENGTYVLDKGTDWSIGMMRKPLTISENSISTTDK